MCTACVHLAWSQMARKDFGQPHQWIETDSNNIHLELRLQGQDGTVHVPSDLKYGNSDHIRNELEWNLETREINEIDRLHRNKRHAGHSHSHGNEHKQDENHVEMNPNTDIFIKKLFKKFSNSDTMNLVEFENMIKELRLDRLIVDDQLNNADKSGSNTVNPSHDEHSNGTVSEHIPFLFKMKEKNTQINLKIGNFSKLKYCDFN